MATDGTDSDFLKCGICSKRYEKARILPCQHSYCEQCLVSVRDENDGQPIECRLCRRTHHIEVTELPVDHFINDISKTLNEDQTESDKCEACMKGDVVKTCVECVMDICLICADLHIKFPPSRTHTIVDHISRRDSEITPAYPTPYCTRHHDNTLKLYCDTCEVAMCFECKVNDHYDHAHRYLKDAATEYKESLAEMVEQLKVKEIEIKDSRDAVQMMCVVLENKFESEKQILADHIEAAVEKTTVKIKQSGKKLKKEIESNHENKQQILSVQLKELDGSETGVKYAREYAENLMHYGSPVHLMSAKTGMTSQINDVMEAETKQNPLENDSLQFIPSSDFLKTKTVGNIE